MSPSGYFSSLIKDLKDAKDWTSLGQFAGPIFGQQSFQIGVFSGLSKSLVDDAINLVGLGKMIVLAEVYQQMQSPLPLPISPVAIALSTVALFYPPLAEEAKRSYESTRSIINELTNIASHPGDFIRAVGRNVGDEALADWDRLNSLTRQGTLTSNFEAGEIVGRVLYQVINLILMVVSVAGIAAKLGAKFPTLLRLARIVKNGGQLKELELLSDVERGSSVITDGSALADQGVAPGLTRSQALAAKRVVTNFSSGEGRLARLWDSVANPGEKSKLTLDNSRQLFDNHRNRFWRAVFDDPNARKLFEDMGCTFEKRGNAPTLIMQDGKKLQMTVDHISERQSDFSKALDSSNLRISPRRENTVLLRLIHQMDPFQKQH